jgi:hypothetical protein
MSYYTGAGVHNFPPYNNLGVDKTALMAVDVGTGNVSLEVKVGAAWIIQEAITSDAVKRVFVGGGTWRAVITGDAAFEWVD